MKKDLKALHGKDYVERFETEQSPNRLNRIIEHLEVTGQMKVCDFGCGNGMLMPYLCPAVLEYTGVDFSEDFITAARDRKKRYDFKNATFFCEDINHFCAGHIKNFDAGFAMDLSEHVPDTEWLEILQSIHTTLKSNSILYLHTPNAKFFIEKMKKSGFILQQFPEHVAIRDSASNAELLQKAGFSNVEVNFLPHYNVLKLIHPFSFIPILGRYFQARLFIRAVA